MRTSALGADNCIALLGSPLCWEFNLHLDGGKTAVGCAWSLVHPSHSSTQVSVNGHQREVADGHYPKLSLNTNSTGRHRRGLGKLESAEFITSTFCSTMPGDLLGLLLDARHIMKSIYNTVASQDNCLKPLALEHILMSLGQSPCHCVACRRSIPRRAGSCELKPLIRTRRAKSGTCTPCQDLSDRPKIFTLSGPYFAVT